ncbi:glycosyltransferase family 2 protein, partial [Escherichia sp. R-CC3]
EVRPCLVSNNQTFGMAAKSFGDQLVTGPRIHTVFKTNGFGKEVAWWKHK